MSVPKKGDGNAFRECLQSPRPCLERWVLVTTLSVVARPTAWQNLALGGRVHPSCQHTTPACQDLVVPLPWGHCCPGSGRSLSALTSSKLSSSPRLAGPMPRTDSFILSGLNQAASGTTPRGPPALFGRRAGNQTRNRLHTSTPLIMTTGPTLPFFRVQGICAPEGPELGCRRGCLVRP